MYRYQHGLVLQVRANDISETNVGIDWLVVQIVEIIDTECIGIGID